MTYKQLINVEGAHLTATNIVHPHKNVQSARMLKININLLYLNLKPKINQVTLPTDKTMYIKNTLYLKNEATKC